MIKPHVSRWVLCTALALLSLSFIHYSSSSIAVPRSQTIPENTIDIVVPSSAAVNEEVTIEVNYTGTDPIDIIIDFGDDSDTQTVSLAGNGTIPNGTLPNATDSITHTYTAIDTYTVTASGGNGDSDFGIIEITNDAPTDDPTDDPTDEPDETKTPSPNETETPDADETETATPGGTETATPSGTETATPGGTETPDPDDTETPTPDNTETPTGTPTPSADNPNSPVAYDDSVSTELGQAVKIEVLGNDTDADGDALAIESVTVPENGSASANPEFVIYTPNEDYFGSDSFTYVVSDGKGGTDAGKVFVNVLENVESVVCEPDQDNEIDVEDTVDTDDEFRQSFSVSVSILIRRGSVDQSTRINYGRIRSSNRRQANIEDGPFSSFQFTAFSFALDAIIDGITQSSFRFNQAIQITLQYDEDAVNGLDETTLMLVFYDSATDEWSASGINIVARDAEQNTITIEVDHLTEFALVAQESPTSLDTVSEPGVMEPSVFVPFMLH